MDFGKIAGYPVDDTVNYGANQDLQYYLYWAQKLNAWFVPLMHEITDDNKSFYSQFFGDLLTRDFWVAPFGTVVRYLKERLSSTLTELSNGGPSGQIVLSLSDTLDDAIYNQALTIRSEVPSSWAYVNVRQGSSTATVKSAVEGTTTVIYYDATPDRGVITLAEKASPLPAITSFSPQYATVGGASFTLTVNGSNFLSGSTVRWNGSSRGTQFVSGSQLTATIAASDIQFAGTATITVLNPDGTPSNAMTYEIRNPVPTLTSIAPASANRLQTLAVVFTGTNFITGVSSVSFGSGITVNSTTVNSVTQITANITIAAAATTGARNVTVTNPTPGGGTATAQTLTINNPAPTATGLSPSSATAGGSALTLTVNGSNFINGSIVRWNGSSRTTTYVGATQLTAPISASDIATAGTATVTVFNPAPGGGASTGVSFNITAANPVPGVTSINPASAIAGGAGFTLTVTGSGFMNGSVVRWNGGDRATMFTSSTQLSATIPASDIITAGTASVTVYNPAPGGGTSNGVNFTITAANPVPGVTSITPASGNRLQTLAVVFTGTNFISGVSSVSFGANITVNSTTVNSATQITANITIAAAAATGARNVTVTNATPGGGTSNALAFTVTNPVPQTTELSPVQANAGGAAFTLTVNGSNFLSGSVVRWNGVNRTTTFVSSTQLRAAITAGNIATGGTPQVTVFNATPGGGASNAQTFTINNLVPTTTSLSPTSRIARRPAFTLTVNGGNFVSTSVVRWNGIDHATTYVSSTRLRITVTAAEIATAGTVPVTVFNPAPNGGTSAPLTFTINNVPPPTLWSISPTSRGVGGTAFTLTVNGTGFVTNSKVHWNGAERPTTYVSSSRLTAAIPASDIASAGTVSVTVVTPAPGGGTSSARTLTIN